MAARRAADFAFAIEPSRAQSDQPPSEIMQRFGGANGDWRRSRQTSPMLTAAAVSAVALVVRSVTTAAPSFDLAAA